MSSKELLGLSVDLMKEHYTKRISYLEQFEAIRDEEEEYEEETSDDENLMKQAENARTQASDFLEQEVIQTPHDPDFSN